MQIQFSRQATYVVGGAFFALFLAFATQSSHAGLFNIPNEPADWNGPYVGFNTGGVWGNFHISDYTTRVDLTKQFNEIPPVSNFTDVNNAYFSAPGHNSSDGNPIGGVDIGYNKQWGMFVAGFGFGFSGTELDDSSSFRQFQSNSVVIDNTDYTADTDFHSTRQVEQIWSGYAGGQIGLAWQRFLFYATGGSAFAQVDARELDRATTTFFPTDDRVAKQQDGISIGPQTDKQLTATNNILAGWYAGGGVMFALSNNVAAGIEYRHSDYGNRVYKFNNHQAVFPGATTFSENTNAVVFKVSIMLGHLGEKTAPPPNH
jgi:outer membrane immunogenic protein